MKTILSFILFLLLSTLGTGQTYQLSGYVTDGANDTTGVENARVILNFNKNIETDKNGYFEIGMASGTVNLVIKHLGYKPYRQTIDLQKDTVLNIAISALSNELNELTVTAKNPNEHITKPIMGVNSIQMQTLVKLPSALGEVDLLRGLQMLPGITSVGEASNGVNIRGGTTDQNLMLLDGMPVFNPTHMMGLFSTFPSDAISSIDVYKGNIPARYGGRIASVLDVKMATPDVSRFSGQASVGLVSERLKLNIPIIKEKAGLLLTGRIAPNDWLLPLISPDLQNIRARFGDASAKLFFIVNPKNTLSLSSYFSYDFLQTDLAGSINEINAANTQYDYKANMFKASWFHSFGKKLNFQLDGISSYYSPKTILPNLENTNKVIINQHIDLKQLKTNFNYQLNRQLIEFGLDLTYYQINPGELLNVSQPISLTPEKALETGFFMSDEIRVSDNLTLSAGIRYSTYANYGPAQVRVYDEEGLRNDNNVIGVAEFQRNDKIKNYGGLEPRLGLNFKLNERSSIKLALNQMRQYLQVISNTTTPIPTSRWKTSDSFIRPQQGLLYSAGYFKDFKDKIYEFSGEVYYRNSRDVVDYKPGANFLLKENIETELLQGINKAYGLELMLSKTKGELVGWFNYTYARSLNLINEGRSNQQQINNGNWYNTNYDRPHTFNAALILNQGKTHDFSFNFTLSSGRPYTAPTAFIRNYNNLYPFYSLRNNVRVPTYHRLDFAWNIYNPSLKEKKVKGNWTFSVYNLYGRKNAYSVYFKSENAATNSYKLVIFGTPIPSLSYNIKF